MSHITRAERVQAFLFLLIGLVVTASVVLTLVGLRFAHTPRTYFLKFTETVSGLAPGAPVRYKGVKYGKVASIKVAPDDPEIIQVRLAIDEGAPIRVSTTAVIATETILGPYHIELRDSRASSPILPTGSYIPASATTLSQLLAKGETLGDQLVQVLDNLEQWTDAPHRRQFFRTVDELHDTLATARTAIDALRPEALTLVKESTDLARWTLDFAKRNGPKAEQLLDDLHASAARVRAILEDGTVEETAESFRTALANATLEVQSAGAALKEWMDKNQFAPALERAVASLERLEKRVGAGVDQLTGQGSELLRADVAPALSDLRHTTAALARLLELLQRQPRALVFGAPPEPKPLPGGSRR